MSDDKLIPRRVDGHTVLGGPTHVALRQHAKRVKHRRRLATLNVVQQRCKDAATHERDSSVRSTVRGARVDQGSATTKERDQGTQQPRVIGIGMTHRHDSASSAAETKSEWSPRPAASSTRSYASPT